MKPQKTILKKAIICFFKKLSFRQSAKTQTVIFLIASGLAFAPVVAQTTITWVGAGTYTGTNTSIGQDFDNIINWDLKRLPTSTDSVVIPFTNPGTINLSRNDTIGKLSVYLLHDNLHNLNNNNNPVFFNVGAYSLTVKGTTVLDVQDDQPNNSISLGVIDAFSSGTIDFMGDVVAGSTNVKYGAGFIGNPNSTIICRGNLTLNIRAQVAIGYEPGTLLFDGTGIQNFNFSDSIFNGHSCSFKNVVIGKNNNPTVVMAGTTSPDNIIGDLTVNGNAVLDLNIRQLNRSSNGGSLFLKNTSTLRLAGLSSAQNKGNPTLIPGSNFPSGFTNIVLDSTSTVEFYGTTQSIPGAAHLIKGYGNLTLTDTAATNYTKTLISSFAMYRKLSIDAQTTMALGDFNDTLKSNSQTTAYVGAVPTTAGITYGTGRFVVERYLKSVKSWRLLATPVQSDTTTITTSWRESGGLTTTGYGTQITGPVPGIGMDQTTQRGSMKWYNSATNKYVEITNTNDPIARSQGYYVFVRGDRAQSTSGGGSATNLRIKGKILRGNQTFTAPVRTSINNGFESVGNPYPSKINFKTASKTNLNPSFTVWDPTAGIYGVGRFIQYMSSTGPYGDYSYLGNGTTILNTIESGQAFFIQSASNVSGTLTIQESDKLGGSNLVSRNQSMGRVGVLMPTLEVTLLDLNNGSNPTLQEHVVMKFDNSFSNDLDQYDVRKFMNAEDNLAIKKGTKNLILDSRKNLTASDTIFLSLSNTRIAPYGFKIDPSALGNFSLKAFLKDKFLQTESLISLTDVTNVNFTTTADVASRATDRFMIVFKSPGNCVRVCTLFGQQNAARNCWGS